MKIVPSGLIDTITQSSGGTTIQNSYGGLQLHKKAYQKKKKSPGQQRSRAAFASVQSSWSALSPEEQTTWISAAGPGQSGFELYSATNNVLANLGLPSINEYVTPGTPPELVMDLDTQQWEDDPAEKNYTATIILTDGELPESEWVPYIEMFPWIGPGRSYFSNKPVIIPTGNINVGSSTSFIFQANKISGNASINFYPGYKAQFNVRLLNTSTGQRNSYLQYESTTP